MSFLEVVKEPDAMGAWSESSDIVWLPRSLYSKRADAIKWAMAEWGVGFTDVRCLSRWMRYAPYKQDYPGDYWTQCQKDAPGAFRVWRLESS